LLQRGGGLLEETIRLRFVTDVLKGDRINAVLSGCGYNMRKLVARLLFLLWRVWLFMRDRAGGSGVSHGMTLSPV
jgi:hypothetical protein